MAAMKPRTGDGPLEATAEGRSIVVRIPTEGGGRLVIEMSPQEAQDLDRPGLSHRFVVSGAPLPAAIERVSQRLTATARPSPTGSRAGTNSSESRR